MTEAQTAVGGGEIPRYRLLLKSPMNRGDGYVHLFEPGTVFDSMATPGLHWEPLNEAAEARVETYLEEKVEILDKEFNPTGRFITRRNIAAMPTSPVRAAGAAPVVRPEVHIVAVPERKTATGLEFAQARFAQPTAYEPPAPDIAPEVDFAAHPPRMIAVAPPSTKPIAQKRN